MNAMQWWVELLVHTLSWCQGIAWPLLHSAWAVTCR